jgi:hypothetical protein
VRALDELMGSQLADRLAPALPGCSTNMVHQIRDRDTVADSA